MFTQQQGEKQLRGGGCLCSRVVVITSQQVWVDPVGCCKPVTASLGELVMETTLVQSIIVNPATDAPIYLHLAPRLGQLLWRWPAWFRLLRTELCSSDTDVLLSR